MLKRILLALAFAVVCALPCAAQELTVSSFQIIDYQRPGTTASIRVWYSENFIRSDGVSIVGGAAGSGPTFKTVLCSVNPSTHILTVPSFTLSVTNTSSVPNVRATGILYDGSGARVAIYFANFIIPSQLAPSTTYGSLVAYNGGNPRPPGPTYPTTDQVMVLINAAVGTLNDASDSVKGRTKISVPAASASNPIAVGDNDPRANEDYNAASYASLTAAVAAMPAGGATLVVSTSLAANGVTVPANVNLKVTGAGQLTGSGTVTIVGGFEAPTNKRVFGAGLTVSFFGNHKLSLMYPEWWGAGAGIAAAPNAAALNAASLALSTMTSGIIQLGPGTYDFNAQWLIGVSGSFTGISVQGSNGYVGSTLNWTGATNVVAVKFIKGRMNKFHDVAVINAVSKGTTVGLQFTSPNALAGASTFFADVQRVLVRGFHINLEDGDSANIGADSDLMVVKNVALESGDIGLRVSGFNSTVINCDSVNLFDNTDTGAWFTQVQQVDWKGGVVHGNGTTGNAASFYFATSGILNIHDVRDEYPDSAGYRFLVVATPSYAQIHVSHVYWAGTASNAWTRGVLAAPSAGTMEIDNCNFAVAGGGFPITPLGSSIAGEFGSRYLSINMHDNAVLSSVPLFAYDAVSNTSANGMRYRLTNNAKITAGNMAGFFPDEEGIIDWPNKKSAINLGAGQVYTSLTVPQITSNQNDYSPANVNYGGQPAAGTTVLRLSTDASRNVTGLVFNNPDSAGTAAITPSDGQVVIIVNVGAQNIVLKNETTSTAAYRFHNTTGADVTLGAAQQALLIYDGTLARWRVSADFGASPNINTATGTSLSLTGQFTSTLATGTPPLVIASTTNVPNLNASSLSGATMAAPGAIGGGTPAGGSFTALVSTSLTVSGTPIISSSIGLLGALTPQAILLTGTLNASTTRYIAVGSSSASASESSAKIPVSACIIRNLRFNLNTTSPAAGTVVITLRKNGVDTALTITIAAGTTPVVLFDTTHPITFADNDLYAFSIVNNDASNALALAGISLSFDMVRQ